MSKSSTVHEAGTETVQHKSRFHVVKLEERIAPLSGVGIDELYEYCEPAKGHYNPHGKWVGGGGRRHSYTGCF